MQIDTRYGFFGASYSNASLHMTFINRKQQGNCPFWSAESMKCRIRNGGLFIPLDDHTEAFCKTPCFSSCIQYGLHSEDQVHLAGSVRRFEENRRKFLRIETSHKITLVKIISSGQTISNFSPGAKTVDMSRGGMRMATESPLSHDSLIQFSFDDSFPQSLHQITGQVEWCNKQLDEPGYQAGVSFRDHHILDAVSRYLGQKHDQV